MNNCTIFLSNGNEINAVLNGTTWYSSNEITEDAFENGLDNVSYITSDNEEIILGECNLIYRGYYEGEGWSFCLNPLTDIEKQENLIRQSISDISDAILEMSEIVYGEGE